jgi:hypothetical protein
VILITGLSENLMMQPVNCAVSGRVEVRDWAQTYRFSGEERRLHSSDIDAMTQEAFSERMKYAEGLDLPYAACLTKTTVADKIVTHVFDGAQYLRYLDRLSGSEGGGHLIDPLNRQPLSSASFFVLDHKISVFRKVFQYTEKESDGWSSLMYRALCGALQERRGCRLLFAGLCADIAPSFHASLGFRRMVSEIPSSRRVHDLSAALLFASNFCLQDATVLLIRAGASVDGPVNAQGAPLRHALLRQDAAHARKLLLFGASPNLPDEDTSETAMHEAARWGNKLIFSELIRRGGDPYRKNREGLNAYDLLRQSCGGDTRDLSLERNLDRPLGRSLLSELMGANGWFGWGSRSRVDVARCV